MDIYTKIETFLILCIYALILPGAYSFANNKEYLIIILFAIFLLIFIIIYIEKRNQTPGGRLRKSLIKVWLSRLIVLNPLLLGIPVFLCTYFKTDSALLSIILSECFIFIGVFVVTPLSICFWRGRGIKIKPDLLFSRLEQISKELPHHFKEKKIIYLDSDIPYMNLFVVGALQKHTALLLTNAILEHLSDDEIKALLYHEVGHVKRKHLTLLSGYLFLYPLTCLPLFLLQQPYGSLIAFASLIGWFASLVCLHRYMERDADVYAAKKTSPELFSIALTKIVKNNEELSAKISGKKFKRGFSLTHPLLEKRLEYIAEVKK